MVKKKILNTSRSNIMLSLNPQQQHNPPRDSLQKSFKQDKSKAMARICGCGKSE